MSSPAEVNLRRSVDVMCWELGHARAALHQRDHILETIIISLENGATPAWVLEWWDEIKPRLVHLAESDDG